MYKLSTKIDQTPRLDATVAIKFRCMNNNKDPQESYGFDKNILVAKDKIDHLFKNYKWNKFVKFTNDFELVQPTSSYRTINRAFFKLWELLIDYELIPDRPIITAHLAEGPGGFIDAVLRYRHLTTSITDRIYAITLKNADDDNVPDFNRYITKHDNVNICYGYDGTGNLYEPKNIRYFAQYISEKNDGKLADLVTADGGFDVSGDFNKQEQMSYKIIFVQVVAALSVQVVGGSFIIKFFDLYTDFTMKLMYIMYSLYDEFYIVKPHTSRPANSEKYIVVKGFRGVTKRFLAYFHNSIDRWTENISPQIDVPQAFIDKVAEFNRVFVKNQIFSINKTLNLSNNKQDNETLVGIKEKQVYTAREWCKQYNIKYKNGKGVLW